MLVFTTDGAYERRVPGGATFGKRRLRKALAQVAGQAPGVACKQIVETLAAARAEVRLEDDLTIVVVRSNGVE